MSQSLIEMAMEKVSMVEKERPSLAERKKAKNNTSGLCPKGRAVLVRPYQAERLSSTLVIPDAVKSGLQMVEQRAVVIEVGENAWHDEPSWRAYPGDHVLITRYSGFEARADITKDGLTYRLINDREIFCVIEES